MVALVLQSQQRRMMSARSSWMRRQLWLLHMMRFGARPAPIGIAYLMARPMATVCLGLVYS